MNNRPPSATDQPTRADDADARMSEFLAMLKQAGQFAEPFPPDTAEWDEVLAWVTRLARHARGSSAYPECSFDSRLYRAAERRRPNDRVEWDEESLRNVCAEAIRIEQRRWREAERAQQETIRAVIEEAKRKKEQRRANARRVAIIMERFGLSRRRAREIYRDGTSDVDRARQLVELFPDTTLKDWHVIPGVRGKRTSLLDLFCGPNVPGCNFFDFTRSRESDAWPRNGTPANTALRRCRVRYDRREVTQLHFATRAELIDAMGFSDGLPALWATFQTWRIGRVADAAEAEQLNPD